MDVLRQGIYDHLAADGTLTALLATYRTAPAIFDGYIPGAGDITDALVPCILYEVVSSDHNDTKTGEIRRILVNIEASTSVNGDPAVIADRIHTLLHNTAITVTGWTNIITTVSGPIQGVFDTHTRTAVLTVEFVLA